MSAGTITLTNGSAIVGGSGTAFANEIAAGDFIVSTVGGVPYTLSVKSVESNTQLTLVSNFTGPTQSGAAWSAVPRVALNMVTAALVAQSAEALRGLNYDKQNWQQVYSAAGNITVKLPDGTTFTGPSWKYLSDNMATKSGGAVPVNQGGTGSTTASGARTNLGLGDSSTRNVGTAAGTVAAGDDSRLSTIDNKSGGTLTSSLNITGNTASFINQAGSPSTGTLVFGGSMRSSFRIANQERAAASLQARYVWGNSSSYAELSVATFTASGSVGVAAAFNFDGNGSATAPGAWVPNSDGRLKYAIERIPDPLGKMVKLRGVTWKRLDDIAPGIGFIAQEVQEVFPEFVFEGGDRTLEDGTVVEKVLSPDTYGVAAALHHEAILALMNQIEDLKKQVEALQPGS
ncbi:MULTISPECIES: tail fiber domain-containing protein [Enterobacter]|uniref:tail fiber domain-containing protein n=1 Tax=Enterobacter TaxID=547 RepID=UPI001E34634A|nr:MULTISPECIES: tail fiber domain-containing protein [Enterobacter]MCE1395302.1 tail fiber domain-containing protein [Enterobacter cloacae]